MPGKIAALRQLEFPLQPSALSAPVGAMAAFSATNLIGAGTFPYLVRVYIMRHRNQPGGLKASSRGLSRETPGADQAIQDRKSVV